MTVYHIASMARCGETMLLRALNAHSELTAVGEGFLPLERSRLASMEREEEIYVVKQGTWEELGTWRGIILIRNPLAVYASLLEYQRQAGEAWSLTAKLREWMAGIDVGVRLDGDDLDNFCVFYNRRFGALLREEGVPIHQYEHIVEFPISSLKLICKDLGVEYEPGMMASHELYKPGQILHAGNEADRAIDRASLEKWRSLPRDDVRYIISQTRPAWERAGYDLMGEVLREQGRGRA